MFGPRQPPDSGIVVDRRIHRHGILSGPMEHPLSFRRHTPPIPWRPFRSNDSDCNALSFRLMRKSHLLRSPSSIAPDI